MANRKKNKKKDLDFQKVKLKVGRRLKRDDRETRAEFKSRKIILKNTVDQEDRPANALIRHSNHITHDGKVSMLNHFQHSMKTGEVKNLTKPIMDGLAKFLVDRGEQVRLASVKCLKTCYRFTKENQLSTKEFLESIKPYLDCAYTHVGREIVSNCRGFLQYLVSQNDQQTFEPLMAIVLNRYETGSISPADQNLALSLKHLFTRNRQKLEIDRIMKIDQIQPLVYTDRNFLLDFDTIIHGANRDPSSNDGLREVTLTNLVTGGKTHQDKSVVEKYLETVREPLQEENEGKADQKPTKVVKRNRAALTRFAQPLVTFD